MSGHLPPLYLHLPAIWLIISWVGRVTPPAPTLPTLPVPSPFPGSGMLARLRNEHAGKTPVGFREGQARRDLGPGHCFIFFPPPYHPELGRQAGTLTLNCASPSQREEQPGREA